ncbi:MAG: hypothetical protein NTW67_06705 [Candidatus Woesearchaeota archaeon]|nr:hypothetical protein [Candidatus Woesearchaeota archaeon]
MRKHVDIDPETLKKAQLYCLLKGMTLKKFVSDTVEKELEPYRAWFESLPVEM